MRKNYNVTVCTVQGKEAYRYHTKKTGEQTGALTRKPIMCIETGKVFESLSQAAKELGLTASTISSHMTGREGYEKVKGYTFKKII
jgi:hypothetical protein